MSAVVVTVMIISFWGAEEYRRGLCPQDAEAGICIIRQLSLPFFVFFLIITTSMSAVC